MAYKTEILRTNIWEIKKSGSLKTLGGLIALFHVLQFYFWSVNDRLPLKLAQQGTPMCWSLMESCSWMHLPLTLLTIIYFAYVIFMAFSAVILILTDWVTLGIYLMLIGTVLGMSLYFQDFRLSTNSGYFVLLMTFAYMFVPSKHRLMRRLIVSFFVARGLSQCAADWLTGSWYMDHLHLPVKLAEWLAAMSVLVQMIGGAGLLFRDARYFWTGWASLFIYACANLYMGEIFGSCLALGALVYVALDEIELRKAERQYIYQSFIRPEPSFFWGAILLVVFWAAQLAPFLTLARNSPLKTALSVWALHPEAAHEECEQKTFAIYKNKTEELEIEPQLTRQPAMYCNSYLRYLDLKGLCKQLQAKDPSFVTLSSMLQVRNFREKNSYRAFEVADFCNPNLGFKQVGDVQWTTNPAK